MNYLSEEERQAMRQQLLGRGMAGQAGAALGAAPMARDAAINAAVQGGMQAPPPTPAALGAAQMAAPNARALLGPAVTVGEQTALAAPQPPSILQRLAHILRGASRSP